MVATSNSSARYTYIICSSVRHFCALSSPSISWRAVQLQRLAQWRHLPSGGGQWNKNVGVWHLGDWQRTELAERRR